MLGLLCGGVDGERVTLSRLRLCRNNPDGRVRGVRIPSLTIAKEAWTLGPEP